MLDIRRSNERGRADHGWLRSQHSFSFADYFDVQHMGFGPLRVINEDMVAPGRGFGTHGHRNMEIISYVLEGALAHSDSMGNGSTLLPGYVQKMSAGTGIRHSEFNPSPDNPVHFLQIWIEPNVQEVPPSYEETQFTTASRQGQLRLIASPDGRDGSVTIHQDAFLYATLPDKEQTLTHALAPGRLAYVHVVRGNITINDVALSAGDALKLSDEAAVILSQSDNAEVLLFDLPQ